MEALVKRLESLGLSAPQEGMDNSILTEDLLNIIDDYLGQNAALRMEMEKLREDLEDSEDGANQARVGLVETMDELASTRRELRELKEKTDRAFLRRKIRYKSKIGYLEPLRQAERAAKIMALRQVKA